MADVLSSVVDTSCSFRFRVVRLLHLLIGVMHGDESWFEMYSTILCLRQRSLSHGPHHTQYHMSYNVLRRHDFRTNTARTVTLFPVQLHTFTLCLDIRYQLLLPSHNLSNYSSIFIPDSIRICLLVNINTVAGSVPSQDVGSA